MNDVHLWVAGGLGLQDILRFELRDRREAKGETEKDKEPFDFTEQASRSFFGQC